MNFHSGSSLSPSAQALRSNADAAMKDQRWSEAFFHLTHAIKLHPEPEKSVPLKAVRSVAFRRAGQLHYAVQDAMDVQAAWPDRPVGWARQAEALAEAGEWASAAELYLKCFQLAGKGEKEPYMEAVRKCRRDASRQEALSRQQPWVGAAGGIIIGALIVVYEALVFRGQESTSYLWNPFLKVAVVMVTASAGWALASVYRVYVAGSRKHLMEPPVDLLPKEKKKES